MALLYLFICSLILTILFFSTYFNYASAFDFHPSILDNKNFYIIQYNSVKPNQEYEISYNITKIIDFDFNMEIRYIYINKTIYPDLISISGIAIDSKDNLYVADTFNDRIQKISSNGNITLIGKEGSGVGEFINPAGIAIDSKDNLYVADTGNDRIQKFEFIIPN
jgi:DNA-binding beta-propeller fold protein YncE